ncbi:Ger(x)C family spore germination protein [Aquibacillus halophilus]|nr:Ger(x)C family spore germination protein [Aquibacillus halophilus]
MFPIVCMFVMLIGCVPTKQIEKLGIVTSYGADLLEDGSIGNTLLYSQFDPNIKEPVQTAESQAHSYEGAIDAANLKTNYKLVTGQIRTKVFGKELAKTGIVRLLSTHFRDASEPATLYIAVSDTTAKDVLTSTTEVDLSKFLYNLIDNNRKREILPKSDLIDFLHKYDDVGIDPVQPLITIEKKRPVIDSIALFQDDIYVDSLSPEETFLIKLTTEKFKAGTHEITLPKEPFKEDIGYDTDKSDKETIHFVLNEIRSKSKVKLDDTEKLSYTVEIKLVSRLIEISEPLIIEDEKTIKKIEKHSSEHFTKQLEEMMEKLKELNVDPIGFGKIYDEETRNKKLTNKEWRDLYPTIDVKFNVKVEIIRHGIMQ